jgi:adenylate cyclase
MSRRLDDLNREMAGQDSIPWPGKVEMGIGLNAGPCCVGNMGSAHRLSYSLVGDAVNLASRIEGLTKQYGVRIALGEELVAQLPEFALIEVDRVRVVGKDRPATVFALLGDEAMALSDDFARFREGHAEILEAYRSRRWEEAEAKLLGQREAAAGFGLSKIYDILLHLVRDYVDHPPPDDWDGVATARTK